MGSVAKRLTLVSQADAKVARGEPSYPARLAAAESGPDCLYVRGTLRDPDLAVAVVGSRSASRDGMDRARELAGELAGRGAQIISGGALGIDAAAHRGALAARGDTVAVLACGLDNPYPSRNRSLFEDVEAAGGALISPYPPGTPPKGFHFVHRNVVMAAMADAVVLVDCGAGSGAMHTAKAARRHGRTLMAVPGSPGTEALIAQGAWVVEEARDVLSAIEGQGRRPEVAVPATDSEDGKVLAALDEREASSESEIAARTGLSVRTVTRALVELEITGLALLVPGRQYVRSQAASIES